jgi:hypothetical protein
MKIQVSTQKLITTIFWVALILVFILLLAGYAYRGTFSRYLQDDYCYSAQVIGKNFFVAQLDSYSRAMPYNSDRFALTLFSGISELMGGPKFDPFLPVLSIALWAAALVFAFRAWQKAFQFQIHWMASLVGAFTVLFFILYLIPNLYQVLYWRSAMFPYLTPLIFTTFLVATYFYFFPKRRISIWQAVLFGLAAWVGGGFSETAAVWQFSVWGLLLGYFLLRSPKDTWALKLLAIPLAGTLLAIVAMALGPGNSAQLSPFKRPDLVTLVTQPLIYAWSFIRVTLRSVILPFVVIWLLGFLVGLRTAPENNLSIKAGILRIVIIALVCYVSVLAEMVPTMLAMSSYPGDRALLPAYFTLILSVFAIGWLVSHFLVSKHVWNQNKLIFQGAGILLGLALFAYLLRTTPTVYSSFSANQQRAAAWDARDTLIKEAAAQGETHVVVPAFDSIAQILELYPNENFWVNRCAASYYGVEGISAVEGYNGVKPVFK